MDFGRMLDVAISLSLMYLILSLFCTIINEYIASLFKFRAAGLEKGLSALADGRPFLVALLAHPLLAASAPKAVSAAKTVMTAAETERAAASRALEAARAKTTPDPAEIQRLTDTARQADMVAATLENAGSVSVADRPSYLSGQTFAAALLDMVNPSVQSTAGATYDAVLAGIDAIPDQQVRASLRAIVNNGSTDLKSARDAVAHWFDNEMERLQGAYKRRMQRWALGVAFLVAAACNADTLHVARTLWVDQGGIATRVAEQATYLIGKGSQTAAGTGTRAGVEELIDKDRAVAERRKAVAAANAALHAPSADVTLDALTRQLADAKGALATAETERGQAAMALSGDLGIVRQALAPLPIGWPDAKPAVPTLVQALGWLLTAFALSLGSSFWFDTLDKFIKIRGAGPKPSTTPAP
ncbi:MAG: hypothetical protein HY985_03865 [Magnetospirillum sp.]|nr:hypothetical protein [Magnetospirillum sp.]